MNLKVEKRPFMMWSLATILSIIGSCAFNDDIGALTIISMFVLVLNVLCIVEKQEKILSLSLLFMLFMYVFHSGQFIAHFFNSMNDIKKYENITLILSDEEQTKSLLFLIWCLVAYTFGALLVNNENTRRIINLKYSFKREFGDVECANIRTIGIILFAVSVIPRVYYDYLKFRAYIAGAYVNTTTVSLPGWLNLLKDFFILSLIFLLLGNAKSPNKAKIILFFSSLYMVLGMLKGNRGQQLICIIALFLVYHLLFGRENRWSIAKIVRTIVTMYLLMVFVSAIGTIRSTGDILSLSGFGSILADNSPIALIMKFLGELGGTDLNLGYAIRFIPSQHPYNYGINYLAGLTSVYPNFGGLLGKIINYYSYVAVFPVAENYGGSNIAEAYVNFGPYVGALFFLIVGYLVNRFSYKFTLLCDKKVDLYKIAVMASLIPNLILWTRDFFYCMIFQYFWTAVLIMLVRKKYGDNYE